MKTPAPEKPDATPTPNTPAATAADIERLYIEARASLMRYVSRYFKRTQEAEDVVQEAFVKVVQAQRKREILAPKSYLFRVARNVSLAHINKRAYKLTDEVGDVLNESELLMSKTLEEQYETQESFDIFCRAVQALPLKCRRAFVLCRVYGLSQKEAAARMGVGVGTIEAHLARGTRRCVEFMEAEQSRTGRQCKANGEEWKSG